MADEGRFGSSLLSELAETRKQLLEHEDKLHPEWLPDSALSDERYLFILEQIPAMLIEVDPDGKIEYVSPTSELIQGLTVEEALREDWINRVHPDDVHILIDFARKTRDPERSVTATYRMRRKDGSLYWNETTSILSRLTSQGVRTIVFNRDVTEMKLAADALAESEERYRMVVAASTDVISEVFSDGNVTRVSSNVTEQTGWSSEDFAGPDFLEHIHPDDRDVVSETVGAGLDSDRVGSTGPFQARHRDGSWRWLEATGATYLNADSKKVYLSVTRDITDLVKSEEERRDLDRRVAQTQRLESLGVMAGGIAHDFNNLLTPILGEAGLCLMDLPDDSPVRLQVLKIEKAAKRAAALTNQMLAYAGEGQLEMERVSLPSIALEMAELLENIVLGRARLVFDIDDSIASIDADTSQLSQVVMNLITNAAEAVESSEGCVTIRCGETTVAGTDLKRFFPDETLEPGSYVFIEVEDDGCGMDLATRRRIFDPFFTTKFTGRGLGLAAVLGIVRGHRGAIEIDSTPGGGTRFRVIFPAAREHEAVREAEAPNLPIETWAGGGTVLVVDDDPAVRELAQEVLTRSGMTVLLAEDGRRAIELARTHLEPIDAVVLDWTMPVVGGQQTLERLLELSPGLPVVLISGYSRSRSAIRSDHPNLAGFLNKPFLPMDLLNMVQSVLDSGGKRSRLPAVPV